MEKKRPIIGLIGAGITGTALAVRFAQKGYPVIAVSSRSLASATKLAERVKGCQAYRSSQEVVDVAELIFVTTPDDMIPAVIAEVRWHDGQSIVHCSGAHSVAVLEPAKRYRVNTGCFHPLQTFASPEQGIDNLPGSPFAVEAEGALLSILKDMATALGGRWIILKPSDKILYHAAAVFASNYLVALVKLAADLWQNFGIPQGQAVKALLPLLRGTLGNIDHVGLPNCLTGPIARGDLGTIRTHLHELEKKAPHLLHIYRELGLQTVPIALGKGRIDSQRAQELQALLNEPKEKQGR